MSVPSASSVSDARKAALRSVQAQVYRFPVQTPVHTSFGVMRERPALFVRIEDEDGAVGWGEVWCNFPDCGAEHRARLIDSVFAPLLAGRPLDSPVTVTDELTERTAVLAIQSGEPGPIHQCIAGLDIALWDLMARRAGQPLWRLLGGSRPAIGVYASGINPAQPDETAARCRAEGHRAFKLKVGFGEQRDLANLRAMRAELGPDALLAADANQAWSLETAMQMAARMEPFDLAWLEEPLRADRPWAEWQQLAKATRIPLAAGENLAGHEQFAEAIAKRVFRVMQPDAAKWGGLSHCLPVGRRIVEAGLRYCPHYLGGGIGLLASAHLLAAAGGDGLLEIDSNPNPLRTLACGPVADVRDGQVTLGETPGLGIGPDQQALREFRVTH
ncbi:MAG TPA: mandelate racemase/muconate lactonizing enzyme family protein [Burkholderiaceae bacterium]|nr:mandelate racemase/muconate lactonizing enzyme family protein [Burkholderiaceae bacterium]